MYKDTRNTIIQLEGVVRNSREKSLLGAQLLKMTRTTAWRKCIDVGFKGTYKEEAITSLISKDEAVKAEGVAILTGIALFEKFVEEVLQQADEAPTVQRAAEAELARLQGGN